MATMWPMTRYMCEDFTLVLIYGSQLRTLAHKGRDVRNTTCDLGLLTVKNPDLCNHEILAFDVLRPTLETAYASILNFTPKQIRVVNGGRFIDGFVLNLQADF